MAGIVKIDITETPSELKTLLSQQKTSQNFARVQALYLLKTGQVKTVIGLSIILGKNRVTIQTWLKIYRVQGMSGLLAERHGGGRRATIPDWAVKALERKLTNTEGFKSYKEIQRWLQETLGIKASYMAVYELVRYKLVAKLKVVRPKSKKQDPTAFEAFKSNLVGDLEILKNYTIERFKDQYRSMRYWCEDETRLGLKTIPRRRITLKGVKPIGAVQWEFKAFYIYGIIEPLTGESFFYEFSHVDADCFQEFLNRFGEKYPHDFHIIQLDNGKFHKAKKLKLPQNIILVFQPAYSPELNPIERLWQYIKDFLSWELFKNLDELKEKVSEIMNTLTEEIIASVTGWDYIIKALSVARIS